MLLFSRLNHHYAAIKDNKTLKKPTNKRKNSNLDSYVNLTSEDSSTRENTWKTADANFTIRS